MCTESNSKKREGKAPWHLGKFFILSRKHLGYAPPPPSSSLPGRGFPFLIFLSRWKVGQKLVLMRITLPGWVALPTSIHFSSLQFPFLFVERWENKHIGRLSWNIFSPHPILCVWFKSISTLKKLKSMLLFVARPFVLIEFALTPRRLVRAFSIQEVWRFLQVADVAKAPAQAGVLSTNEASSRVLVMGS